MRSPQPRETTVHLRRTDRRQHLGKRILLPDRNLSIWLTHPPNPSGSRKACDNGTLFNKELISLLRHKRHSEPVMIAYKKYIHMILKKEIILFLWLPLMLNAIFLGLYISGITSLQLLLEPRILSIPQDSWREFGILELSQNIFLLGIIALFLFSAVHKKPVIEKIFFATGAFIFLFVFLEEIDYGLHLRHIFSTHPLGIERMNWHNQNNRGHTLRIFGDLLTLIWFLIIPLLSHRGYFQRFKSIVPSFWFLIPLLLSFLCSSLAHHFAKLNVGMINGLPVLSGNISEFREVNTYYISFLYALQLTQAPCLILRE